MAKNPLHILLVNNYTARGGIPKAVAGLANAMRERGHNVTIISQRPVPKFLYPLYGIGRKINELSQPEGRKIPLPLGREKLQEMYPLKPGIKIWPYSFTDKNLKIQKLRRRIRTLDPDVCVCPLPDGSQIVWAVTLLGSGVPYVYSEHHCPDAIENVFWTRKGRLGAMSGADAIHLLLPSYLDSLPDFLRDRATAIPNPVALPEKSANPAGEAGKRKVLLWLGRLHDSLKQCRLALDAFALLADKYPDWDLHMAGEGQDSQLIHAHAAKLHLGGRIRFLGEIKDVWPVYASAQVFCFSSRTEGMPFVLLESLASGLPAVAFAQCPGVRDLIRDGENGLLAGEMTAEGLSASLEKLLSDEALRIRLGENARSSVANFSEAGVYDAWENLLRSAAAKKGSTEMDKFSEEPFASMARLSSMARREWLWRDFGGFVPGSLEEIIYRLLWVKPLFLFRKHFMGKES